ncbi:arginine utilization regulatory protein [Chryseomicrobium aureum]|uniref:sigma 54-interacting transcriptional regulator n=1 Tax=Chryseomicrobium aureum TaxID=1441723 RepID=UPI00195B3B29|nr:sigma 54-interacting transcriptional regulator [Chryseomicrobium aureum]MBM7707709.1 arginine utilization regulatory protein [Chryseomicrobium aureum]
MNENSQYLGPFYRFAIDQVGVGVHAIDKNGKTVLYNDQMRKIEGLHSTDVEDRSILEVFQFEKEESTLLHVLSTGKPVNRVKQTYWNNKGREITTINDTYPIFEQGQLIGAIEFARDITALERLVYQPLRRYNEPITLSSLTAVSETMRLVISKAKSAAQVRMPLLLIGEAGTGKDLIAEGIHHQLTPSNDQFISLFCHSSDPLLVNKFREELKNISNSTIFCERIDLLSLELQKELLHILQTSTGKYNLFIASVGSDPIDLVASRSLSRDLYYYFASMTITVPPLRERKEDIVPFVEDYLRRLEDRHGQSKVTIDNKVQELLLSYDWPGNLKELELLLDETSTMLTMESTLTEDLLPVQFRYKLAVQDKSQVTASDFLLTSEKDLMPLDQYLREAETYYLQKAVEKFEGNITKAAEALGMSRQNLQYRLRKLRNARN